MDFCISLSDILERIKSNRYNILDLIIEYIIKDKDLRKSIEDEIGKIEPIRQENGMILQIDFNRGGEDSPQPNIFQLYLSGNGYVWIDWGDETPLEKIKLTNTNVPISHQYEDKINYEIIVYGQENAPNQKIYFGSGSTKSETNIYLEKIISWGDLRLVSLSGALNSTIDTLTVPNNLPPTVKDLSYLLRDSAVSDLVNIGDWNTSKVTNMSWMFYRAVNFNGDISNLNTTNVTDMSHMFREAISFNGDISDWNTTNVTNMSHMFREAVFFNKDISDWNTSKVTDMSHMFQEAKSFDRDIGGWDTSSVKNMSYMFAASNFKQNIGGWDTSYVEDMSFMFFGAVGFSWDLSGWCVLRIPEKPENFDTDSGFEGEEHLQPDWGQECS
ncbi:MAG: DUF285 domain-containing protein [Firmicutes bacterium]|nr:DUF285 domain-containing protein [Bacillota bacterium]